MGHTRHLLEALSRAPGVDVAVLPEDSDFVIDANWLDLSPVRKGPQTCAVMLRLSDPHGVPLDVDNADLADHRFLDLLSADQRANLARGLDGFRAAPFFGPSLTETTVRRGFDILAMNLDWPFRAPMVPRLGRVGYMRVDPRVPEWIFRPDWSAPKTLDGFFVGCDLPEWYPLRWRINRWWESSGLRFSYNPGRPVGDPIWASTATFDAHQHWYAGELRRTKLVATCGSVFNIAVGKYFEAMACGCLLLAPLPHDADLLGFRSGYNMVEIGPSDYADKILYYLTHDAERETIARRGAEFCHRRHSAGVRAAELVERLGQIASGVPVEKIEADRDERLRKEWELQSS